MNSMWHCDAHELETFDKNPFLNCGEARTTYERICRGDKAGYQRKVFSNGERAPQCTDRT